MDEREFLRLIQRWQDPGKWQTVNALATQAAEFDSQADKLGSDARFLLDRGDIEQAGQLKPEADHLRNCVANLRQQRSAIVDELLQIEKLVREHRPELLEFVPIVRFDCDPSEAIRDLKRLEGRVRETQADDTTPPATKISTLPLNLHPCDVEQSLKRDGFTKVVTIPNEGHWKLMEALMAAFPNAVPESKLNHIFQGPNDRDNYSRKLKSTIDDIGLTVQNWVLMNIETRP